MAPPLFEGFLPSGLIYFVIYSQISKWPIAAAQWSGVSPLLLIGFFSSSFSKNNLQTSKCPPIYCSNVFDQAAFVSLDDSDWK